MNDIKILWFRQDLRISDNPALSEASKTGSIIPIYIHDTKNSDVYINGSRLIHPDDYSASDGSTVGLTTAATNGDVLELVAYKAFNVGDVTNATLNFQVGSQLTVTGISTLKSDTYVGIDTARGVVLTSPNGTAYRLIVSNAGALSAVAV